jgi:epoxide hydrolase 4
MFPSEVRATYRDAWTRPHALTSALNYYRNVRALRRAALAPVSWQIDVPTLVLWGEKDPALVPSNLDGLERLVPRLAVRRHPSATHWIVHEEPEWVNEAIHSFVPSD